MSDTEIPLHQQIGAKLRALREAIEGFTQNDVAREVGVTYSAISLIEKGTSHTTFERYDLFAKAVGARFAVILAGPNEERQNIVLDLLEIVDRLDPQQFKMLKLMVKSWQDDVAAADEAEAQRRA